MFEWRALEVVHAIRSAKQGKWHEMRHYHRVAKMLVSLTETG